MSLFVARIKGFVRFKDLMGQLVSRDLKLKYRRSVLGYLWSAVSYTHLDVYKRQALVVNQI